VRLLDLKVQTLNFAGENFRKIITFKHDGIVFNQNHFSKDRTEDDVTLIKCNAIRLASKKQLYLIAGAQLLDLCFGG